MTTPVVIKGDISSIFEQVKALKKESGEDLVCFAKLNGFKLTKRQALEILSTAVASPEKINKNWMMQKLAGWGYPKHGE